jgi:hypothetical protein
LVSRAGQHATFSRARIDRSADRSTRGSDFSFVFSFLCKLPNSAARRFHARFWQRPKIDIRRWMGTISRGASFFLVDLFP